MNYSRLVEAYERLESTQAKLQKTEIIADLFRDISEDDLYKVALLLQGRVFPAYDEREIGIAAQSMEKIIAHATGFPQKEVGQRFKKTGDLGLVAEELMKRKKQQTLMARSLDLNRVFENLQKLAGIEGKGSQDVKFNLVAELVSSARPKEAKYIVRTTIGDLRIGVAEGILRDAIARAFLETDTMEQKKDSMSVVEWAWFVRSDYGEIAVIAKKRGVKGLKEVKIEVGKPYHVLLAEKSPGLEEAINSFERPAMEFKYDGARLVIHKSGEKLWFYTRRMENITRQFPELQEYVMKSVSARECIIEGEMLGFDKKMGKPMPFQFLSQRIKRKYDIEKMVREIPVQVNLFDITFLDGEVLFEKSLEERWKLLNRIVRPLKGKFQMAEHIETRDLKTAEEFYSRALEASQEGLIVKNLDAKYHPGRRVAGGWLKVKPIMETLDLAIIGATWGTGKRAGWMGSYILGCRDGDTFRNCGMIGTGIKEKEEVGSITFRELTKLLKPKVTEEHGNQLKVKPDVVVEVAYEEIQKSPNYDSGYALRFPRVLRVRTDKSLLDVDTKKRIEKLYKMQKGKRGG